MRPRKLSSPEDLYTKADNYFDECEINNRPITLTGLIYSLGLSSRQSLGHYENREEFCDSVRRVKLRVEMAYEEKLHGRNASGAIFALKNFGWSENKTVKLHTTEDVGGFAIKLVQPEESRA